MTHSRVCIATIALIVMAIWGPISSRCEEKPLYDTKTNVFEVHYCNWNRAKEAYLKTELEPLIGYQKFMNILNELKWYQIIDLFSHPSKGKCVRVYIIRHGGLKDVKNEWYRPFKKEGQ